MIEKNKIQRIKQTTCQSVPSSPEKKPFDWLLALPFIAFILSCANMGSPDGGPYDETPPKVVSTSPSFGAVNVSPKKIVINFDENIKLEDASQKIIISPPQIEQPEIDAYGKKITVKLLDSLKKGFTYTIDFSDAIVDNNEGNPMGDYAFTFSTGDHIDTMQISGTLLNAEDLEPIKGVSVGLYYLGSDSSSFSLPDSVFRTRPLERISRTDESGHFVIKGVAPGYYKAFALQDQDQNYVYSQNSERIAFSDMILHPYSRPDIRFDTVWHDSLHYDSIVPVDYTHFYPDDVVLTAFLPVNNTHYFLKSDRSDNKKIVLYFTSPSDSLPVVRGLNYDATNAFYVENTPGNDTITYWILDSLIYEKDSLITELSYMQTNDSTHQLELRTDTLVFVPKINKARRDKMRKAEMEDFIKEFKRKNKKALKANPDMPIPTQPETWLTMKFTPTSMDPLRNADIIFEEPIDTFDITRFHFFEKVDTLYEPRDFLIRRIPGLHKAYRLYAEWKPGTTYQLQVDTGAVRNIYGEENLAVKRSFSIRQENTFSALFVDVLNFNENAFVQLLNSSGRVVKTQPVKDGKVSFYYVTPGDYFLRLISDANGNGEWDTGDYDKHIQPEQVFYFPGCIPLKAGWDINQDWDPRAVPLVRQKPLRITKQKPTKTKEAGRQRNAQRRKDKGLE